MRGLWLQEQTNPFGTDVPVYWTQVLELFENISVCWISKTHVKTNKSIPTAHMISVICILNTASDFYEEMDWQMFKLELPLSFL